MINRVKLIIFLLILTTANACMNSIDKNEKEYNEYRCETKAMSLKGVIVSVNTKSNYMGARLDNKRDFFSLNIASTILKKGFPEDYSYRVGDSLIKIAASKEFVIKRGKKMAIYILECND